MHENAPRSHIAVIEGSSNRYFGLVFAAFFLIVGLLPMLHGTSMRLWALLLAAGFLIVALTSPGVLGPLNRVWTNFGLLLHRIVSPVAIGILFFGVVTPISFMMRALGKDPLRLRLDQTAASYWIERIPPGPAAESLKSQF